MYMKVYLPYQVEEKEYMQVNRTGINAYSIRIKLYET